MEDGKWNHSAIAVFVFLAILLVFNLGGGEVQPWDEGLFAIRAKSIIKFGAFWDQTQYSAGGLYSSTYPPLSVWLIALTMKIFGTGPFALRFFSAVFSLFSTLIIFKLARKLVSSELSLLTALLTAGTLAWNHYSRQGMTDMTLIFFILLSFYSIARIAESDLNRESIKWLSVFVISFTGSLLTKIVVSFLPLLFIIVLFFESGGKKKSLLLLLCSLFSILIALPWHYSMAIAHGNIFLNAFTTPHLFSGVENNIARLGIFYYLNQLMISNPFFLFTFIPFVLILIKSKLNITNKTKNNYIVRTSMLWFALGFLVLSLAPTKLPHYTLLFIPPAIITGLWFFSNLENLNPKPLAFWLIFSGIILCAAWSFGDYLRIDMKDFFNGKSIITLPVAGFFILIALSVLVPVFIRKEKLSGIVRLLFSKICYVILILIVLRIVFLNTLLPPGNITGGEKIANTVKSLGINSFVYLYHEHNSSDTLNPQLGWYLDGWLYGWQKGKTIKQISLSANEPDFVSIRRCDIFPGDYLVYYLSGDVNLAKTVFREIRETRPVVLQAGNYVLFGRAVRIRNKGVVI